MVKKLFVLFFLILVTPGVVFASHKEKVLGIETTAIPQIAPTSEGPGLLLPDSPLFFLDKIKQNIRFSFALTPEGKAKIRADIAGERMAELRIMLARNNKLGITFTLREIADNLSAAGYYVSEAQLTGRDVSKIAQYINATIKTKQQRLDALEQQTNGQLKAEIHAAQAALLSAKVTVEDALPEDALVNETKDDLQRQAEKDKIAVEEATKRLESAVSVLGSQSAISSKSAKKE